MKYFRRAISTILIFLVANQFSIYNMWVKNPSAIAISAMISAVYLLIFNIKPTLKKHSTKRIAAMSNGTELLFVFICTVTLSTIWAAVVYFTDMMSGKNTLINIALVAVVCSIIFWNGIIRVYLTSVQLGIKWRVIGIICGMIPVANILVLTKIISLTDNETEVEEDRFVLDNTRVESEICKTKYPVIMVHGVFFRDFRFLNYWGRIPAALKKNGADIYYGGQQSAAAVKDCGVELAEKIKSVVEETGCEKVNIIAHSKGGLDSRYAISNCGMDKYVASLTTVNTPHRGCIFAKELIGKASDNLKSFVSSKYNSTLLRLGDKAPDFMAAVTDLTDESCAELNKICPDMAGVYYQSVGSYMKKLTGGKFPLNVSYNIVKKYDGVKNDGLVEIESMKWGESFTLAEPKGRRGISHGDMIDLNRENIDGFDVREFYISIVSKLKDMGY